MKSSPLKRSVSASKGGSRPVRRATPKKKQPRRDWTDARAKVDGEGRCRACKAAGRLEAAHVVGRVHDGKLALEEAAEEVRTVVEILRPGKLVVHPDRVVPLCPDCHSAFDAHSLDLLPYLTEREQLQAVQDAGGIGLALRRVSGRNYRERAA